MAWVEVRPSFYLFIFSVVVKVCEDFMRVVDYPMFCMMFSTEYQV
jgi:hypothetical protein